MPPIIDIHGHTIPRRAYLRPDGQTAATPAELVGIMDRLGVDKMVVLPLSSPEALHFVQSNEEALEACAQYPDRFIPFCSGFDAISRDPEWGYAFLDEFQDRLLFGMDICLPSQEEHRARIVHFLRAALADGKLSRDAYDKIMGGNAVRLLRLDI